VAKVLKWMMGYTRKKKSDIEDDTDNDIGMKMSVVGRKMTESITKKGTHIVVALDNMPPQLSLTLFSYSHSHGLVHANCVFFTRDESHS